MFAGLRLAAAAILLSTIAGANSLVIRHDASPITLPIVRRMNMTSAPSIVKHDQARAKELMTRGTTGGGVFQKDAIFNVPATNQAVDYTTTVTINNHQFTLIVDTGSANTWVGARPLTHPFVPGPTTMPTGDLFSVTYGSGFVIGTEFIDTVTLAGGLSVANQSFGSALISSGFSGVDGILGLGPVDLTIGTLIPDVTATVPTVTDNAFAQGLLTAHEIGISFEPTNTVNNTNGEITFGGVDAARFTPPLEFVPITTTSPSSMFVGIDQSITYGSASGTTVQSTTSGVVDTGTTLLLLATDAFDTYRSITGAVLDPTTGFLRITPSQFANLQSLFFHIGSNVFEFTANAQIWPRSLNSAIGGSSSFVYLVINDLGTPSGSGLDFIDGMTFLERFYHVYDIAGNRAGFATTPFTFATTN